MSISSIILKPTQAKIQELEAKLQSFGSEQRDSPERVDALNDLAWEIALSDTKRAASLTQEARELAEKTGYERGVAYALRNSGYHQLVRSDLEAALKNSREALAIFERSGDRFGQATALDNIALTFWRLGNFDEALQYSLSALELNRAIANKRGEAWALHNIAAISVEIGDFERAIANYENAHKIFQEIEYEAGVSGILSGLGDVFLKKGDYKKALEYYLQALELSREQDIPLAISRTLTDIGTVYEKLGDIDRAFEYHRQSLRCFDEFENNESKAFTLLNLGRLHGQQGDSSKALKLLHEALVIAERTKAKPTAFRVHEALFQIYESQGDYEQALAHHRAFHRLKEEVYNEASNTKLRNLQIRAEVERAEKEAEIQQLKIVNAEKMDLLEKLVAGLAHEINSPLGVIRSYAQISELTTNKLVTELNMLASEDGQPTSESIQRLATILESSSKSTAQAGERIAGLIEGLKSFASLDQGEVRMVDIHAQIDNTLGLLRSRLSEKIEVVTEYGQLPQIKAYPRDLNQMFMTLLINAFDAVEDQGTITIRTSANKEHVEVRIADTGKGIPKERLARIFDIGFGQKGSKVRMRFGLANTYNIVQKHQGEIKVQSEVGQGTEFRITLPVRIAPSD